MLATIQACFVVVSPAAVGPIFKAAMEVFEGHILTMHQQKWGVAPATATDSGGVDGGRGSGGGAAWSVTETSAYVNDLAHAIAVFR